MRRGRRRNRARFGKLCAALGMRVVGTRRHPHPDWSCHRDSASLAAPGISIGSCRRSDFVVICCQWTPETTRLFDKDRFAAMKRGGVLINVARGEIVDEEALADALQRDHLRGAALDVYVGEFEHTPMSRLWSDPRVLITPHISSPVIRPSWRHQSLLRQSARLSRGRAAPECHRLGTGLLKANRRPGPGPELPRRDWQPPALAHSARARLGFRPRSSCG